MKHIPLILMAIAVSLGVTAQSKKPCADACCKKSAKASASTAFTCKLTSPELRERKATVLASLKKQVVEKKELDNGFAYKFTNSQAILDELNSFVKDEKECCDFLSFEITTSPDKKETWLKISGADGVKDFLTSELEM
jgi:hypothetical protein